MKGNEVLGMDDPNLNNYEKPLSFYTETYRKPDKNNKGLLQLIIVALVSSILGGIIVYSAFQFAAPALQTTVNSLVNKTDNTGGAAANQNNSSSVYKKIEIAQSNTPVTAIAEKVSPSVVGIKAYSRVQDLFFGETVVPGEGSGIIIRADGYILTNNHVIEGALVNNTNNPVSGAKIEVILSSNKNKTYTAKIIGRDSKTDLAVLKIDAANLPAAELGNSDNLKPGELAVAIGNPAGMDFMGTVTAGIISGLNRKIQVDDYTELTLIQTDAAINPGNSGGALVNSQGQVIGINTIKISATGYEGLGFAIPINTAKQISASLIESGYVKGRPFLGVQIDQRFTGDVAKKNNVPEGLLVYDVTPLSGAYGAGIQKNDIITKFDEKPVKTFSDLNDIKNKHVPGDTVAVEVYRDGQTKTFQVKLTEDKNN